MVGHFQDHLNQWNRSMTKNVVGISGDMTPSDRNLKDNITVIPNALDKINAISGNTFNWKSDTDYLGGQQDLGVIAQEVEALGLVGLTTTRDNGTKAVRYDRLIPVLIEAVKELTVKVNALENK